MQLYADKDNNDFKKAFEKLKQDKQYQKSNEIQKQEGIAFREYFKNFIEMENYFDHKEIGMKEFGVIVQVRGGLFNR